MKRHSFSSLSQLATTTTDPMLAALADNDGPTQTHLPQPGSSAICEGSVALVPATITTDQRG